MDRFKEKNTVIVYGMTNSAISLVDRIARFTPAKIVIAEDSLNGQIISGIPIISVEEGISILGFGKAFLVICSSNSEIIEKLDAHKFKENIDYFYSIDFSYKYMPLWAYEMYQKYYLDHVNHITNYACTLKCKNCSASIPYLHKKNPSLAQIKQEIDQLFRAVDYVYDYDLTSGESLLVQDLLSEIIDFLCTYYNTRIGKITIFTNGTVLPSSKLLKTVLKYKDSCNIVINVSVYETVAGWKEKYSLFKSVMDDNNIEFDHITTDHWIDMGWRDVDNTNNPLCLAKIFDSCITSCRAYEDGIMYYCLHGHFANKAFFPNRSELDESIDVFDPFLDSLDLVKYNAGILDKKYLSVCQNCRSMSGSNTTRIPIAEQIQ